MFSLGYVHIDVRGGDGAHMLDKHSRSDFAFRKWNKLTVVLSSFHNECAPVIILVFCDSPLAAIWPKTGLWCSRPPHSPHRLQINHWNPGTFSAPFFGTAVTCQWPQRLHRIFLSVYVPLEQIVWWLKARICNIDVLMTKSNKLAFTFSLFLTALNASGM